jgi:hypothetical protein
MANRSKQRGTAAESAVVGYLQRHGHPFAERRVLHGSKDLGDITGIPGAVIEIKDCVKLDLAGWTAEAKIEAANAGVPIYATWFKKRGTTDPGEWYVVMPGSVFVKLID